MERPVEVMQQGCGEKLRAHIATRALLRVLDQNQSAGSPAGVDGVPCSDQISRACMQQYGERLQRIRERTAGSGHPLSRRDLHPLGCSGRICRLQSSLEQSPSCSERSRSGLAGQQFARGAGCSHDELSPRRRPEPALNRRIVKKRFDVFLGERRHTDRHYAGPDGRKEGARFAGGDDEGCRRWRLFEELQECVRRLVRSLLRHHPFGIADHEHRVPSHRRTEGGLLKQRPNGRDVQTVGAD